MTDGDATEGHPGPMRDLTPEERVAMEEATRTLDEEIRVILADPAYRAARGPTYAERREAAARS